MLKRALHRGYGSGRDSDVAHGRGQVTVAQQRLHDAYIYTLLDQVRCKSVAQAMHGCMLADARCLNSRRTGRIQSGRIERLLTGAPRK